MRNTVSLKLLEYAAPETLAVVNFVILAAGRKTQRNSKSSTIVHTNLRTFIMQPDHSYDDYMIRWTSAYQSANYDRGLAARLLTMSHIWCERAFGHNKHFSRVLEVGAGTGIHIQNVRHTYDEYVLTDLIHPCSIRFVLLKRKMEGRSVSSVRMLPI